MLSGWRLCKPQFARSIKEIMSGEGASLFGGRWNSKGVPVVYLGSTLSLSSMEMLVHLKDSEVLQDYNKLQVSFPESLVEYIDIQDLPKDWAVPAINSSVQFIGDDWVQDQSSLVLQVPSVVIPEESNYLINPKHPDFEKLIFSDIESYRFDPRLFKV